jgi:hypothetical protein
MDAWVCDLEFLNYRYLPRAHWWVIARQRPGIAIGDRSAWLQGKQQE